MSVIHHRDCDFHFEQREGSCSCGAVPQPAESKITTLECPCCGETAATSDVNGVFEEGQEVECMCMGLQVSIEEAGDDEDNVAHIAGECDIEHDA